MRARIEVRRVPQQQPERELPTGRNALSARDVDDDLDRAVRVALRLVPELVEPRELLRAHRVVHWDVVILHVRPEVQLLRAEVARRDEQDLHVEARDLGGERLAVGWTRDESVRPMNRRESETCREWLL